MAEQIEKLEGGGNEKEKLGEFVKREKGDDLIKQLNQLEKEELQKEPKRIVNFSEGYEKKITTWTGNTDFPEIINIAGEDKRVSYMEKGIIQFEDNSSAAYERIKNLRKGDPIAILEITYKVKKEK